MNIAEAIPVMVVVSLGTLLAYWMGWVCCQDVTQKDAIDHNMAHWEVDPKTGEKKFVWNNSKH